MQILKVEGSIVCSSRHEGFGYTNLRLVSDIEGKLQVATDTIGVENGNWVFVVSGSAARYAAGNFDILTDLTIGGIMDKWSEQDMLIETN
ncbi:MAG: carboxysome peptide B [Gammaproteobacteria bacterium]|nr:carboxysome peptide B [Gammaproteobacteria bacterium]